MSAKNITINLPTELDEKIEEYTKKIGKSQTEIIQEALQSYFEKKEIEKWEKGFELASKDKQYIQFCRELGNDDGGIA